MSVEETGRPNYAILTHRFMASGQWDRALDASRDWLGGEPENLRAHRAAAQSLINLGRQAEAEPHLRRVLAGNPKNDFAHRLMSMVQFDAGRPKEADESIRQAIALNPRDAHHWHQLALLSYRQGDLATARKSAERARELSPRDPQIANMVIMCEPQTPGGAFQKIHRYEQALELDPENAYIYNNIGAQYLVLKDYPKAEEYFRRALYFEPASQVFRRNLFLAIKHRDLVYRALRAPRDFLFSAAALFSKMRKGNILLSILMIPVWLVAFRFIIAGLLLWFMLVWPLTKVYEYLTIGDIRARAGEIGARRGGFLGFRKWPLKLRLGIFTLFLVSFWGGIVYLGTESAWFRNTDNRDMVCGILGGGGVLALLAYWLRMKIRRDSKATAARKRAERMKGMLESKI